MPDPRHTSLSLDDTEPHPLVDAVLRGLTFGRYVVRDIIGSGAMGVVYRAHDPELDREIALKVLHKNQTGHSAERLLGEAQAMARIHHPNVIAVYDVGTVDGQVFLAMELITGMTLDKWRRPRRSQADVLRVFRAAAEGLRAAHDVGVVHRDFKPENVLVGDDGRVCVTDFGLACATSTPSEGLVVGTPAYMAPEQKRGDAVDGRANQFSFCMALFESVYGKRPFKRHSAEESRAVERRLRRGAPATVRHALRRGLQLDAGARFADMAELLRALAPRRQLRLVVFAAATATVLAAAGLMMPRLRAHQQIGRCRQAEGKIATLWSPARQSELQAALAQAQLGSAWTTAKAALDRWTRDWTGLHAETCMLGVRPDAESQSLFDLRMECLNQRWQEANQTLTLLTTQPKTVKHATHAIASLQPIDSCAGAALRRPLRPTMTPEQLRPINEALARARADFAVENCREALTEATRASDEARALGALGLQSEARTVSALSQMCLGDRDAARVSFMDTAVLAEQAQEDDHVVTAYLQLINLTTELNQYDDAQHWLQRAREAVAAHGASVKLQAQLEYAECYLPSMRGRVTEAEPHCRRSCELFRQLPTRTVFEADAVEELGQVLGRQGKFAESVEAYHEAQRLARLVKGPDSTDEIRVLEGLSAVEAEQDHTATALALQQRVVEHGSQAFPAQLSIQISFYGFLLIEAGRAHESIGVLERALAMAEKIKSEHPFETGAARAGLGSAYLALGQPQVALGYLEEAKRISPVEGNEDLIAQLDLDLAKALWSATPHRSRAIGLARQARDYLRAHPLGALRARHTREVESWLAAHEKTL